MQVKEVIYNIKYRFINSNRNFKRCNSSKLSSFASGFNPYKLIWLFLVGSIIGFLIESLWCIIVTGNLESRKGLLYGPFKPIYGFGAIIFTLCLYKIRDKSIFLIFLVSSFVGALFEYFCSWFQEIVFGSVFWKYDGSFLNLNGRINLLYTLCWGLIGVLYIKKVYPLICIYLKKISCNYGKIFTWILFFLLIINILITALSLKRLNERNQGIEAKTSFATFLDNNYDNEHLSNIFPNMIVL